MARKYCNLDICVVCKSIHPTQRERIERYCPVYVHKDQKIYCKVMIINYDTAILDYLEQGKVYMVVHADYTQSAYTIYPKFNHPKITKVLGITKYICKTVKEKFNVDCELCYNPLVLEEPEKRIKLVSATRLSKVKGGNRMKMLADELDRQNVNYIWYVLTDDQDCIHSPNVIFINSRLDAYKWIQEADIIVQLSDTEAMSYTINERTAVIGKQVCVTPLPYLESIGINSENAIILNFDCSNIKEVVEKIKKPHKVTWQPPQDNYKKYLIESKSDYLERRARMKNLRVLIGFWDTKIVYPNREWEEANSVIARDDERAKELIDFRHNGKPIVEIVEAIETAKKEVVAEKAVKKTTTKKVVKKDAKK